MPSPPCNPLRPALSPPCNPLRPVVLVCIFLTSSPPPPPARSEVNLWPEDIPNRTLVVLAGKDKLIHVDEVGEGGEGGGGQGVGGRGQ